MTYQGARKRAIPLKAAPSPRSCRAKIFQFTWGSLWLSGKFREPAMLSAALLLKMLKSKNPFLGFGPKQAVESGFFKKLLTSFSSLGEGCRESHRLLRPSGEPQQPAGK